MKPLPAKRHVADLALNGGTPAFASGRFVGQPNLGDTDALFARLQQALSARYLSNQGPLVAELEERLAAYLGVQHCVTTTNGTQALELMLLALDLQPNGENEATEKAEVIVPSFTFVATAHAIVRAGLTPVFCDVNPRSHTLDPESVERCISSRTRAILGVHLWGHGCDVGALQAVAERHDLHLLFDACQAFGSTLNGQRIGGFGGAEAFSFHATKLINCFEGGAVTTNSTRLARRLRRLRNFGFGEDDQVQEVGTNGKLNEANAAMGLTSLEAIDGFIARNHRLYNRYRAALRRLQGVHLLEPPPGTGSTHHYIVIEIDATEAGISRDALMKMLWTENVHARRYFHPGCHRMPAYSNGQRLPHTERLSERVLTLPCSGAITEADVDRICQLIAFIQQYARDKKSSTYTELTEQRLLRR